MVGFPLQSGGIELVQEFQLLCILLCCLQSEKFTFNIEYPAGTYWSDTVNVRKHALIHHSIELLLYCIQLWPYWSSFSYSSCRTSYALGFEDWQFGIRRISYVLLLLIDSSHDLRYIMWAELMRRYSINFIYVYNSSCGLTIVCKVESGRLHLEILFFNDHLLWLLSFGLWRRQLFDFIWCIAWYRIHWLLTQWVLVGKLILFNHYCWSTSTQAFQVNWCEFCNKIQVFFGCCLLRLGTLSDQTWLLGRWCHLLFHNLCFII